MSRAKTPPLYALLVGINDYKHPLITPLQGCVPDVEAVERFLLSQLDVPKQQVTMLRNSEATYDAVIRAFEALRKRARKNAQVLVYFSCHGSQAPAVDPTIEADGLDESLVLYDSRTAGVYDLLDKELGYLLDELVQKGLYVTVVLDACHSGSGTRAPEERVRLAMRDGRTRPLDRVYGGDKAMALARTRQLGGDWVNPGAGEASYVLLAGCRDEQRSREMEFDGQPRGLFSYYLLDELSKRLRPSTTYADLHQALLGRVRSRVRDQEPQAEGAVDRLVFGAGYLRRLPPVALKKVELDVATVDMGAAQGLSEGSTLLAFVAAEDMTEPGKALARLTVFRAGASESSATIELLNGTELPITALLQVERYAYAPARRVLLDGPGLEAARSAVSTGGPGNSPTPFVELVAQRDEAQMIVRRQGDALQVLDHEGVPLIADLTVQPHDEARLAGLLLQRLEHLARYWFAYELRPKPAEDKLAGLVRLELCRVLKPGNPPTLEPLAADDLVVRTGDALAIRLTNLGADPLYVSLWNFTADWAIVPVFPPNGGTEKLMPGEKIYEIGEQENPPGGRAEAVELLKLFVTKEPTNAFQVLAQDELELPRRSSRGATEDSPLGAFLADLAQGKRAIGGGKVAQWSAVDVTVRALADPKALPVQPGKAVSISDGVTLHSNDRFSGTLRLATLNQATRGTGSDPSLRPPPTIAAAPDLFEPVALGRSRGDASPALVLSLDGDAAAFQSVSSDAPLTLDLPADLVGNDARLLAVAYDGENYVLVGRPGANPGGSTVTIEYLPLPQDNAATEEVKQRGLAHTVRLMFFKVTGQTLDLGLRRADVADGVVRYEPVAEGSIAPGSRVLLCIHGISDDTRWITRDLGAPLQDVIGYDHLLTFDYESFGTSIRDNADTLWAALHDAGIQAGRNVHLDIVTHSMGGLLARALVELGKGADLVHAVVMAGTPNAGSPLASAARFGLWLGSMGLGLWPGYFSKVAAWALTWVDGQANGLKDLQPGAAFLEALNTSRRPASVGYYALAGIAQASDPQTNQAQRLLQEMLEGAADLLLRDPENDLVVTTHSMASIKPTPDKLVQLPCNHSGYFSATMRETYMDELVQWLSRPSVGSIP